jgi:GNAT superfamily N-acetyltransferase
MSGLPDQMRLLQAMDATWRPAGMQTRGPWVLRRGLGGGKRVSAATTDQPVTEAEIDQAEAAMHAMEQPEIFMLQDHNAELDGVLETRGYRIVDPVLIFAATANTLVEFSTDPHDAIPCVEPLALMREIWAKGGIARPRIDVMHRASDSKTFLFSRHDQTPAGVAFIAVDNEIAMLHALEVVPEKRRFGVARKMMGRAAIWAIAQGADIFSVVVTSENLPARGLYTSLGMQVVGKYHYRMK